MAVRKSTEGEDELSGYVMIDARAVILGLPEQVTAASARLPLRGSPPRSEPEPRHDRAAWRAMLGAPRRQAIAEASATVSFWQRLGRKLGWWSGATTREWPR